MVKDIYLILHNIRSAYNVGSIFRTADAAGVGRIYLGGYTPTPDTKKVIKTSLGAERSVKWEKCFNTWKLIEKLKSDGMNVVALEQSKTSRDYLKLKPKFPLAIVVGNEVRGLSSHILKRCDSVWHIPMRGQKESLNVAVASGIFLYKILE
ncbi:MAG: RNA methyltransferase [Parcubacteria group bacterium]|nr:RNA methyltransferase [Parcubacteria group bacterium]